MSTSQDRESQWWRRALCRWWDHDWRSLAVHGVNGWVCDRCGETHGDQL